LFLKIDKKKGSSEEDPQKMNMKEILYPFSKRNLEEDFILNRLP